MIEGVFCVLAALLAQPHGNHVGGTYPEEHGKGHSYGHEGQYQGKTAEGDFVDTPTDKDPVNHVVKGVYQHSRNCRKGKTEEQAAHGFYSKAVCGVRGVASPLLGPGGRFWGFNPEIGQKILLLLKIF